MPDPLGSHSGQRLHTKVWDNVSLLGKGIIIEEASAYFRIGEHTLRRLVTNNPDANFVLHVGTRTLIKKRVFADFLDRCNSV